ncbi:MAG TPA: DNA polymerase III subunit gamma/tau, partial [Pirellulaceae bacterium]|nr:DNA polymerase III subunit gamma/tau [Pirellulaceae bacterium]
MPDAAPNAGSRRNDDAYVVVARRYRPTSFEELIGQDQVSQALRAAITSHRVGHAYLFTGARGVGKTSTARIFGKALNCVEGPTPTPCNRCDVCLSVAAGEDVDVLEIDGASNRGIEEIRQLRSTVGVRPSRGRYKVYIIDEVHMLTTAAFNALLKTLEEPPEHVKFIFCTTDPEKIPITVLSRCQRFDFPPVKTVDIQERLRQIAELEGVEVEPEALGILARRAAGSMRDSQSLLEQLLSFSGKRIGAEDVHRMLGTAGGGRLAALLDAVVARDIPRTLIETDGAVQDGVDAGQLAEQLLQVFRDVLVLTHQGPVDLLSSQLSGEPDRLRAAGERLGAASVMAAMQILDQAVARMRHSLHARVLFEMAVVRLATLADLDAIDRLVRVVARGENPVAALSGGLMPTGLPAPGTSPPVPPSSLGAGGGQRSSPSPAPLAAPSALPSSANSPHPPATSAAPAASADSRSKKNDLTDPEGRATVGATTGVSGTTEPNGALSTGYGDSPSQAPSGRVPGAAESLAAA